MHRLDAFVVPSRELIRCENIFGIVIADLQQAVVFPFFCFRRTKLPRHLYIKLFILPSCHKVDLSTAKFTDIDGVSSATKFQVHDILKARRHAVGVVAENAVSQGSVCKVELFLRFQDFLTL